MWYLKAIRPSLVAMYTAVCKFLFGFAMATIRIMQFDPQVLCVTITRRNNEFPVHNHIFSRVTSMRRGQSCHMPGIKPIENTTKFKPYV